MVNQVEETEAVTIRDGWRIGWSRRAWRIFLLNLLVGVPVTVGLLILLAIALAPVLSMLLLMGAGTVGTVIAALLSVGLVLGWVLLAIAVALVVSPLLELGWRFVVLQELSPLDSVKQGLRLIRSRLKDIALTLLILVGVGIGWTVVSLVLAIAIVVVAILIGGIPALIAWLLTRELLAALIAGAPLFLLLVIVPLTFAGGLYRIFQSAVWTLVFRELTIAAEAEPLPPAPDAGDDEALPPADAPAVSPPLA